MNTWFDFLATQPLVDQAELDVNPPGTATLRVPLTQHRLLQVTGPDAVKFLQGQLTCDLRRLEQQDHLLGAHCNAKGRMISSFTLADLGWDGAIGLRLRHDLADTALAALRKYIVFSKARVEPAPLIGMALIGNLSNLPYDELPPPGKTQMHADALLLRHNPSVLEIWAPETSAPTIWQAQLDGCTPATPYHWDRFQVDSGIAEVRAAISEEFVPQMLNYHLIDGVSFKKGCYTGQEIIARMQYKGQLKKHTYAVACNRPLDLKPGDTLSGEEDTSSATVVACAAGNRDWRGLVVTMAATREKEAFLTDKKTGEKLTWLPLPYAIP
jgi:folate-binding protein YgfZ